MNVRAALDHRRRRLMSAAHKLRWGVRTVGVTATARGVVRLVGLRVRRPTTAAIHLQSGPILTYDYPSQLVPALVVFGDLIDPEFPFLRRIARPSWIVFDVGAAIGQFTVFAALLPCRQVHAFEPSADNVRVLRTNVTRNGVADRVVLHQTALAAHAGEARFATASRAYMSRLDGDDDGGGTGTIVPVQTLDAVCRDLDVDRVDVLKVNVAGFEPDVLDGADDLLRAGGAAVLVLLIGRQSIPAYTRLAGYGYRFFLYHPVDEVLHEVLRFDEEFLEWRPWPARNLIGVHPSAIAEGVLGSIRIVSRDLPG